MSSDWKRWLWRGGKLALGVLVLIFVGIQFQRDLAIARTRHAVVEFVQQQEVGISQRRMMIQDLDDAVELGAALDVPHDNAQEGFEARRRTGGAIEARFIKQLAELALMRLIKSGAAQFGECLEAFEFFDEMLIAGRRRFGAAASSIAVIVIGVFPCSSSINR